MPESKRVADRYVGLQGAQYAGWQLRSGGPALVRIEARIYQPHIDPTATVLDFGCGGGALLSTLACGRRIGVEPLEESRTEATGRGIEVVPSLDRIPDLSVDVVISHHALEHCTQPFTELTGIWRVLKRGGRLILMVPIEDWRVERGVNRNDRHHHLFAWTPLVMGNLLAEAGFVNVTSQVVSEAWDSRLARLPWILFWLSGRAIAMVLMRRQMVATATRP